MYCKKCGNPINETDITCKICGALISEPLSDETKAEINDGAGHAADSAEEDDAPKTNTAEDADGKRSVHHTEFNWNVYDFPKPKKTEDLQLEWSPAALKEKEERERQEAMAALEGGNVPEPAPQVETSQEKLEKAQEKLEKAQETEPILKIEQPVPVSTAAPAPQKGQSAPVPAPEKEAEAEAARAESVRNIEKFFTFTKKNEEFQHLLDKEYEKIKSRREGEPYIEPEAEAFVSEQEGFVVPDICNAQSEFERMILEGTTPVEEAAPIEDLLHRRTIPVDLAKIQAEAKKAEETRNRKGFGSNGGENRQEAEQEIPSFKIPKKSMDDIVNKYAETGENKLGKSPCQREASGISAAASVAANEMLADTLADTTDAVTAADITAAATNTEITGAESGKAAGTTAAATDTAVDTTAAATATSTAGAGTATATGTRAAAATDTAVDTTAAATATDMAADTTAAAVGGVGAGTETGKEAAFVETELSPDDILARELSEMAAARESFLRQLAEEKAALKRAEEEAARRVRLEQELKSAGLRRQPGQVVPEMTVNQSIPAANAEIQVTVAVKAGGGIHPQETVSVISTPAVTAAPACASGAYASAREAYPSENSGGGTSVRHGQEAMSQMTSHVIDADAVEVRESALEKRGNIRKTGPEGPAAEMTVSAGGTEKPEVKAPPGMNEPWHENTLNNLFAVQMEETETEDEEEGRREGRVGKIILSVIAIILAIEILALGIKYFAPESAAAEAVRNAEIKIVKMFSDATGGVTDFFSRLSGDDKDPASDGQEDGKDIGEDDEGSGDGSGAGEDAGTAAVKPDPAPMADKTALIAAQADKNKNIKEITASDDLKYVSGKNYKFKDINDSKPLENNIWKTLASGETLYYDQSVVGTLIAFDSQWQDYVNNGTKDALSLLKEGSKAYEYASTFSGVGKETQSFESLQIGEIRRGDSGSFYIWAKEQIKKTGKGQNKTVTYYWIYHMEPVGDEMKIVNYTAFK